MILGFWGTLAIYLILTIVSVYVMYKLLRHIAMEYEERVIEVFNRWWRPVYKIDLKPGAKVEMVVPPNKKATVWWDTMKAVAVVLAWLIMCSIALILIMPSIRVTFFPDSKELLLLPQWVFAVIFVISTGLGIVIAYWILEWRRRNRRLVVCTDRSHYVWALPAPFGVIPFLRSKRIYVSSGHTYLFEEPKVATDVEDIGGKRTPWLRDRWTERLAEEVEAGSILLPSRVFGAEDMIEWVSYARGTNECLVKIARLSNKLRTAQETADRAEATALIGRPDEHWTESESAVLAGEVGDRVEAHFPSKDEGIDLFTVEDPGLWDRETGKVIELVVERERGMFDILTRRNPADSSNNSTAQRSRGEFEELWGNLSRMQEVVVDRVLGKEESWLVFERYGVEPEDLAKEIIEGRQDKRDILNEYPVS